MTQTGTGTDRAQARAVVSMEAMTVAAPVEKTIGEAAVTCMVALPE